MLEGALDVYLVDGTYELFRHYYALPSARDPSGCEVAAVRGVLASVLGMISNGAAYIAVATDHVIAVRVSRRYSHRSWSHRLADGGV